MRRARILFALLLALGSSNLAAAQEEAIPPVAPEAEGAAAAPVNPNPLSGLSLDGLSATRSLPLFTPSRTAPFIAPPVEEEIAAPVEPEPEPEQPPPSLQLVGIVLSDTDKQALLLDPASNEVHRLTSGDEYEGWALTIVDARSVEFRSGERVEGLKMFESFPAPSISDGMIPGYVPPGMVPEEVGSTDGMPAIDGMPVDGMPIDGMPVDAMPPDGMPADAMPTDIMPADGMGDTMQPGDYTQPTDPVPPVDAMQPTDEMLEPPPPYEVPPPESIEGFQDPSMPPPEGPPPNFDPALGEVPLPDEGPLPVDPG